MGADGLIPPNLSLACVNKGTSVLLAAGVCGPLQHFQPSLEKSRIFHSYGDLSRGPLMASDVGIWLPKHVLLQRASRSLGRPCSGHAHPSFRGLPLGGPGIPSRWVSQLCCPGPGTAPHCPSLLTEGVPVGSVFGICEGITSKGSYKVGVGGTPSTPSLAVGVSMPSCPFPRCQVTFSTCPLPTPSPPGPPGQAALFLLPMIVTASKPRAGWRRSGLYPRGALSEDVTGMAICHPNRAGVGAGRGDAPGVPVHLPRSCRLVLSPPSQGSAGSFLARPHLPLRAGGSPCGQRELSP